VSAEPSANVVDANCRVPGGDDRDLENRLAKLRDTLAISTRQGWQNPIVIWEAIGWIAVRNSEKGRDPFPTPEWINHYLLRAADKVGRLWLGIHPKEDRPLSEIGVNAIGELRMRGKGAKVRDARADYVAAALEFTQKGVSAFQKHDRLERDEQYLQIADNPELDDHPSMKRETSELLQTVMRKNEGISSPAAAQNRLSQARKAQRPKKKGHRAKM